MPDPIRPLPVEYVRQPVLYEAIYEVEANPESSVVIDLALFHMPVIHMTSDEVDTLVGIVDQSRNLRHTLTMRARNRRLMSHGR